MVLMIVRQGGWTALMVAKMLKGESENDSRKPRDLLNNSHSDSLI
jgi:hypothetical protein